VKVKANFWTALHVVKGTIVVADLQVATLLATAATICMCHA